MTTVADLAHRAQEAGRGPHVVAAFAHSALLARRPAEHPVSVEPGGEDALEVARRRFKQTDAASLRRETFAVLESHRRLGHTLVLVSGAGPADAAAVAEGLGIAHVVPAGPDAAGALVALGADLERSFAYGGAGADAGLLASVAHPAAVGTDAELAAVADRRGWPVVPCRDPAGRPGVVDLARTTAFYGAFATVLGAGIGVGLVRRSRQAFVDVAIGVGSEVSLAVAGVDVRVVAGAANLWGPRPAVFVFNHTSKMDAFVAMKLLREDFTGVAKAEAKKVPMFGQLFQAAGMAFIDRRDSTRAVEALAPVVEKLRSGTSIVVSPEGTRTPTPRLGPFKKGPFHIAMQAGVPIVPMLFRGVDEIQWRGAQVVRPGRVEVVVLDPVDTSRWRPESVAEHRDEVRGLMAATLDDWPATGRTMLDRGGATA